MSAQRIIDELNAKRTNPKVGSFPSAERPHAHGATDTA